MSSPTPDDAAAAAGAALHMIDFLLSLGPAGIVAAIMWMWKEREAKRADVLQEKFDRAIDKALADEEDHK